MPRIKLTQHDEYLPICGLKVYPARDVFPDTGYVIRNFYEVRTSTTNSTIMIFDVPYRLPPELELKTLSEIVRPYAKILVTAYQANQCKDTGAVLRNSRKG